MSKSNNIFWIIDPKILYTDYLEFYPTKDMSRVQQLNALSRLCIYYLLLSTMLSLGNTHILISVTCIVFIVGLYYVYISDPQHGKHELYREKIGSIDINNTESTKLEAGYRDSNGKLHMGSIYDLSNKKTIPDITYKLSEINEYQKNACKRPTKDNPFMNPIVTDFNKPFQPSACNADDEDIKDEIEDKYNVDLYRNIEDLYNVKNSQRQFYTVPVTQIPNDQTEFAKWLYKGPSTCKVDQEQCLRYEDLRFKR